MVVKSHHPEGKVKVRSIDSINVGSVPYMKFRDAKKQQLDVEESPQRCVLNGVATRDLEL